jgi:hypothetical protein
MQVNYLAAYLFLLIDHIQHRTQFCLGNFTNLPFQITNEKMRNCKLFLMVFLAWCKTGFSQITLTVSDIANIGDQVITSNVPYAGETPAPGSSMTYDLITLQPGFLKDTTTYIAAAGTPFAAQMQGANICQRSPGSYTYFVRNSGGFYLKGFVFSLPVDSSFIQLPGDFVFAMSPQIPIMTFPATMGMNLTTQSTSSRIEIPFDTTINYNGVQVQTQNIGIKLNIKDTSVIDGWGTAVFPGGEYPVLRNRHNINLSTTLELQVVLPIFGPTWIPLPSNLIPAGAGDFLGGNTRDVMLWTNGRKQPLVTMALDTLGQVFSADVQADLLVVSNRSIVSEQASFEFYPNPASSAVSIKLPEDSRDVRIREVSGKCLKEFSGFGSRADLSVSDLPDGVYILETETVSGGLSRKKLVVRH